MDPVKNSLVQIDSNLVSEIPVHSDVVLSILQHKDLTCSDEVSNTLIVGSAALSQNSNKYVF